MRAKYVDQMGSDLSVVNAARVSFDKISELDESDKLKSADEKLIAFLARENHWTPFGHASLSLHVKAPMFVARQLGKHQVGLVWNEISRRYVDSPPEFFYPDNWRKRNVDKKQGSHEDEFVEEISYIHPYMGDLRGEKIEIKESVNTRAKFLISQAVSVYMEMLEAGVCPEQARMILPQNTYTEWYWSGSLIAFARVCNLRLKKDTQLETRIIAQQISDIAAACFPISWQYLRKG